MKRYLLTLLALIFAGQLLAEESIWTEKAQNPSWWPFRHYDSSRSTVREDRKEWYHDMDVPCPTNRYTYAFTTDSKKKAREAGPIHTNLQLVAEDDPFKEVTGYWPTMMGAAAYLDGKYMIAAGQACNIGYSVGLYFPGMASFVNYQNTGKIDSDLSDIGYYWPSNTFNQQFSYNRSVQFAIYDVANNTWDCSKWDGSGPPTFVNMENGKCDYRIANGEWGEQEAVAGDGARCGSNQAFLYDFDESGTPSFFIHAGYPNWSGNFQVYNPGKKREGSDYGQWSGSSIAGQFSSGYMSQYEGGAVCIDGKAYVVGGGFWGPDNMTNLQIYDTKADQWTIKENIYGESLMRFGIATIGSKIYLIGDSSASTTIRVLETATNKYHIVESPLKLQIGVREAACVGYKGVIYVIGGRTYNAEGKLEILDTFQIVNTVLESAVVHSTRLPVAAYNAACAVTEDGQLLYGGSMMSRDPKTGKNVCGSRLWVGQMPSQDIYITPSSLEYGQDKSSIDIELINVADDPIEITVKSDAEWLPLDTKVTVPSNGRSTLTANLDREKVKGPVTGSVTLSWGESESTVINASADMPRPVPVFSVKKALTLQPRTKTFKVRNDGTESLNYKWTSDSEAATISPAQASIGPGSETEFTYTIGEACPRPGKVTFTMSYNSFDGSDATFVVENYPAAYYVSPSGDDKNDGTSREQAWKTLANAFESVPSGDAEEGSITLYVAPAIYAGDSQHETWWTLDLSKKSYLSVVGESCAPQAVEGACVDAYDRPVLTPGAKKWHKGEGGDVSDDTPFILMNNCDHVRFSNFILDGNYPDTNIVTTGVGASLPNITALIGIDRPNGVQIDHNYFCGNFKGECYDVTTNQVTNWEHFYYCGMTYNGTIGKDCLTINNNLFEGFAKAIYHNGYPARSDAANTNWVYITANTFTKQRGDGNWVCSISSNFADTWYGAAQICTSNIFAEVPDQDYDKEPLAACSYITGTAQIMMGHDDYAVLSQYNQYYDIGGPGGDYYYADGVTYELDDIFYQVDFTDYTNEVPNFVAGTWYLTDPDTPYGERKVGWAFIPEPVLGLGILLLGLAALRRK